MHRDAGVAEHRLRAGWWRRRGSRGSRSRSAGPRRPRRPGARRSRRPPADSAAARDGPWSRPARPRGRRSPSRNAGPSSPAACRERSAPCGRTRRTTRRTASWKPGSMVKRLRDRSNESPSRRHCSRMVPPDCSFHSQTLATKASRPISRRPTLPVRASSRSTTICVAMPAWSRPGCQSTSNAAHPVPARQDVHQRVVEGVPHMQAAGDVRRRQQDAERLGARLGVRAGAEGVRRLPGGADRRLGGRGVEGLFHRHRGSVPAVKVAVS